MNEDPDKERDKKRDNNRDRELDRLNQIVQSQRAVLVYAKATWEDTQVMLAETRAKLAALRTENQRLEEIILGLQEQLAVAGIDISPLSLRPIAPPQEHPTFAFIEKISAD